MFGELWDDIKDILGIDDEDDENSHYDVEDEPYDCNAGD